jgi:hypothetical protein
MKKGLQNKLVTVFNPENDDEFELFVSYEKLNETDSYEDNDFYIHSHDFDIKNYVSSNNDEIPEWLTEEMVHNSLNEIINEEFENLYDEDLTPDDDDDIFENDILIDFDFDDE